MKKISTIGIIGGGQLGRMICFYANRMGFKTVVFSDIENSPASFATNQTIVAKYTDKKALAKFAKMVDVATFEFENIPFECADFVASKTNLSPKAEVLKIAQNRISEKTFLNSIGVKTADYAEISSLEDLLKNLDKFKKAIIKTATMGYDGKGQAVLENADDAKNSWKKLKNHQLVLEKFCPFDSEISVMVARSQNGEISAYEPLTNIHKNGILDKSIYPARISKALKTKAQNLARKIAREIDLVGILAVEMFVIGEEIIVNELAPRPHNSGHFSMDACITSQFEQLICAICDLPLGSTDFHSSGFMKNLIGDEVKSLDKYHKNSYAKIHLYGKDKIAAGRKMGHVNILNSK
jgi:5-(carboxyamino)imidazole ribonucleotide synthase